MVSRVTCATATACGWAPMRSSCASPIPRRLGTHPHPAPIPSPSIRSACTPRRRPNPLTKTLCCIADRNPILSPRVWCRPAEWRAGGLGVNVLRLSLPPRSMKSAGL